MDHEENEVKGLRHPPHNIEAEERLLSALCIDPAIIPSVREILKGPEDFYRAFHQDIYRAICSLADGCGVVDGVTIHEELVRISGIPDQDVLGRIFTRALSSCDASYHAEIVREKARLREMIEASTQTLEEIYGQQYTASEVLFRDAHRISRIDMGGRPRSSVIRMGDVVERDIEWLWPGRIPLGKQTTIAGPGGVGKSFLLCDVAARVSAGLEWPLGGGERAVPGNVLIISGEDEIEDTIVPRLRLQGADPGRIMFPSPEELIGFNLKGPNFRRVADRMVRDMGGASLLIIDPPSSFLAGIDENSNAEVRGMLTPMKEWAHANRCAVVFNTHVNKGSGKKLEIQQRVIGSVAMVNGPRMSHMVTASEDDPDVKLFVPLKSNIWQRLQALSFRIVSDLHEVRHARLEWIAEVDIDAGTAMNGRDEVKDHQKPEMDESITNRLERWMIARFKDRPIWTTGELANRLKADLDMEVGATFDRVSKELEIRSRKVGRIWERYVSPDWVYAQF